MTSAARRSIIIIVGGGASGVILALHLLRQPDPDLMVTIVERRPALGQGLAYSTTLSDHVLNLAATNMSPFPDNPLHFRQWLSDRGVGSDDAPFYAPRSLYGRYLGELLAEARRSEEQTGRLRLLNEECLSVAPTQNGVAVRLANGTTLVGNVAVLAVGHDEEPAAEQQFATRIGSAPDTPLDPQAPVLVLGTGLSMVDAFLTLESRGHLGPVIAISRRGLLPWPHRPGRPVKLDRADIMLGTELSYFVDWFLKLVRSTEKAGGDWRDVVDGLRPFNQLIWQNWPTTAKRRFLRHTKAWWDIHRHRMAPHVHARVTEAMRARRLRLLAGRVVDVSGSDGDLSVRVLPRRGDSTETLSVARVYDCTGIVKDVSSGSIGVVRSLIDHGLGRPDPLRLGLDVALDCAVIDAAGHPTDRLFAIGPLTRGTFFEIDAIPDIRVQCMQLAARLSAKRDRAMAS